MSAREKADLRGAESEWAQGVLFELLVNRCSISGLPNYVSQLSIFPKLYLIRLSISLSERVLTDT